MDTSEVVVLSFTVTLSPLGPKKVSKVSVLKIATKETEGDTEIKGGVKYIYTGPAGLEEVYDLYIYLPGAPLDELPERFLDWASKVSFKRLQIEFSSLSHN